MKKILCCILSLAMLLTLITGCGGGKPAPVTQGGKEELMKYLEGSGNDEYLLTLDATLDITGLTLKAERTVILQQGITLKLTGTFTPGAKCITVRAQQDSSSKPKLDLTELMFNIDSDKEVKVFEVHSDVSLNAPPTQERLFVDTSENEWTSVKVTKAQKSEPQNNEPQDDGPNGNYDISSSEEFLEFIGKEDTEQIVLQNDITVTFNNTALTHDVFIVLNGNVLTLKGTLNMQGGIFDVGENPDVKKIGKVDVSGLTVTCERAKYTDDQTDIFCIGVDFKHIIGEPALGEGIIYEIPDSGAHASVKLMEITTPEQHEAKLNEDMTQYLSGVDFPGGVGISAQYLADGVLEIHLDNPVIDHVIGVMIDGDMKLVLTGSVTFDGGHYCFERTRGGSGTAIVDITALEINGTKELGDTKSPDIFRITGSDVVFLYNESAPHIEAVQNEWFWLRYVQ